MKCPNSIIKEAISLTGAGTRFEDMQDLKFGVGTVSGGLLGLAGAGVGLGGVKYLQRIAGSRAMQRAIPAGIIKKSLSSFMKAKPSGAGKIGKRVLGAAAPFTGTAIGGSVGYKMGKGIGENSVDNAYRSDIFDRFVGDKILGKKRKGKPASYLSPAVGKGVLGAGVGLGAFYGAKGLSRLTLGKGNVIKKYMPKSPLGALAIGSGVNVAKSLFNTSILKAIESNRESLAPGRTISTPN